MLGAALNVADSGSYSTAVSRYVGSPKPSSDDHPPVTRMLPLLIMVAVCSQRPSLSLPSSAHVPARESYRSMVAEHVWLLPPPMMITDPSVTSVAVCLDRASIILPASTHVPAGVGLG